jgi:hypothetical protein
MRLCSGQCETKRHYQLGMVDQVRQNLEKANENVYGGGKVLRFYDGQHDSRRTEDEVRFTQTIESTEEG